ncbi:thiamine phosphate synthase [Micromonospora zingiberis]|uniref:Thiamine phosphate synthase n=1 Tax=Micromonospora zingiberis TaxID=2053011 RepID=A0A4R0GKS3_9ACTN|nr:thiamine phosphate synthase [Micromonospora zingiberis]
MWGGGGGGRGGGGGGGGVRWVVLREKDLPPEERRALAAELRPILAEAGGTLIVAGPDPLLPPTAPDPGGAGDVGRPLVALHLSAAGPYPPPAADLVGRSCHDEAELRRLTTEDYVTLSPVHLTRTKPGYGPPLQPEGLARLIRLSPVPVPVLALGGIETPAQVRACVEAGAAGVAVLGAIMRAPDPRQAAAALTSAFHTAVTPPSPGPAPPRHQVGPAVTTGMRPTVPTRASHLTGRSGRDWPPPATAPTEPVHTPTTTSTQGDP